MDQTQVRSPIRPNRTSRMSSDSSIVPPSRGTPPANVVLRDVRGAPLSARRLVVLIVGVFLLLGANHSFAQRGGGRAGRTRPFICIYDCPDPSEGAADPTGDDLKKFDRLMAVQATPEQGTSFATTQQDVQAAATQIKILRQLLEKGAAASPPVDGSALSQLLARVRTGNQSFLASFSPAQELGLKDLITKLINADSDLGKQMTILNETFGTRQAPASLVSVTGNLDQAFTSLQSEQLALAREMSILPGEEQGLTFHLPQVTTTVELAGQQISLPAAGEAIRTSVVDGRSLFDLRVVVDLSDLQDSITDIFRSRLTVLPRCGEHIEVRQGMLLPQSAASLAVLHLHHEHWVCPPGAGRSTGGELLVAAGDATVEIKLSPSVDPNGDLHLASKIERVDADEAVRDSLLTGSLGATLAEQTGNVVLSGMQKGTDLKATLPTSARNAMTIQKTQFQGGSTGQLRLVLDGQLQFSDEQTKEFAAELKWQLTSQTTSSQ